MVYLTLAQCKQHLLVDASFTGDDDYITGLAGVAEQAVEQHLDRPLAVLVDSSGNLPAPVTQAMLLMVGNLYANREPVAMASVNKIPYTLEYLIGLYQKHNIG
jgi:hypothetical protein